VNTRTAQVRIGTSGWAYDHWKGTFYPDDLADADRLAYYAGQFGSVEINNSFYRLPDTQTLAHWRDSVPADFRFAVKASRYITHMKKLKDPGESLAGLLERIAVLGAKCGPMLFQLPPNWRINVRRLAAFLDALPGGRRYAFEFRDHSWLNDETYALLTRHGAALRIYDLDGYHSPRALTTDFAYIRLHGPAGPYQGSYDTQTLSGWSGAISAWTHQGHDVYVYFDNDQAGHAAADAARLRDMTSSL
jgi:uncharacterized protein YecE (DUF72 family)